MSIIFLLLGLSIAGFFAVPYLGCRSEGSATMVALTSALAFLVSIGALAVAVPVLFTHANDLGTIRAQEAVIQVYVERKTALSAQLDEFRNWQEPTRSGEAPLQHIELRANADSPYRALIEALTETETLIAEARAERAKAIRSIAQRKAGPFSFIVSWYGER